MNTLPTPGGVTVSRGELTPPTPTEMEPALSYTGFLLRYTGTAPALNSPLTPSAVQVLLTGSGQSCNLSRTIVIQVDSGSPVSEPRRVPAMLAGTVTRAYLEGC